jgi:hypothetical protein
MILDKTMNDRDIRAVLRPFCEFVGREVKPVPFDRADLLVQFMAQDSGFIEIRRQIANTHVAMARARRPGSSTKAELKGLEGKLLRLESERQRIISTAASSAEFTSFRENETQASKTRLEEWLRAQDVAVRARQVLAREQLPRIVRPDEISVLTVLKAVENHVEAAPPVGSLVLMGEQPRPSEEDFQPVSAYASGLNPRMFSASVRLHVAIESDRGRQAEVDGAMVSREALVMRLSDARRPVSEEHWEKFEDILPLAARREVLPLLPYCIPFSSPYSALRSLLSTESWRAIRNAANDRNNGTCVICGMSAAGEVRAEWKFLEPLRHSGAFGIQRLVDVRPYCSACGKVVFPEPDKLVTLAPSPDGYQRSREVYVVNPTMRRLGRVNRWDDLASPDPLAMAVSITQAAYQRRSAIRWALDLSVLHGMNVSLHPDMVMHRKGWIMRKSDVPLFDDGRSVHLTRIFGTSFVNSDGGRVFFEVPPVHLVPWDTSVEEVMSDHEAPMAPQPSAMDEDQDEEDFDSAGPLDPDSEDFMEEEGPPLSMI